LKSVSHFVFHASSRERDAALAEHKAAIAQFEADRSDYTAQIEHLKEQVHDTERHRQEAEEQVSNYGIPWHGI
jgi:peptidoglycan hydrolase CwlO-like protein